MSEAYESLIDRPLSFLELKKQLAWQIVYIYHDKEKAVHALQEWERVYSKRELPEDIPLFYIGKRLLEYKSINIVKLLVLSNLVLSNREARRLINQSGVSVDGIKITNDHDNIELSLVTERVLKAGKRRYLRVMMCED
jgi:tyrosyl-tRNA synthetase